MGWHVEKEGLATRAISTMKRFILYAIRWQLSTPILAIVCGFMNHTKTEWVSAAVANAIGSAIFFLVDRWIFKHKEQGCS